MLLAVFATMMGLSTREALFAFDYFDNKRRWDRSNNHDPFRNGLCSGERFV